ncbi:MAG: hypothetical protein A2Y15_07135 [Clostridiales bacterium GWF2_36_10]|nr:MAG: hypothetical protein A2Y15_07135 [Clostridiales bacterium GWF2_36_10]HAN21340.1 recombinase family protein [Clostridiales bacterium]
MDKKVTVIPPKPQIPGWKWVGIYCRVSSSSKKQLRSFSSQASGITQYVIRHPDWKIADIYLDVESGADALKRNEFQRLLYDCVSHKLDLVVVKSLSRFSRDTIVALEAVRKLRANGIDICFMSEQIYYTDGVDEQLLTIYSSIAQDELEDHSMNVRWSIEKQIADGTSALYNKPCYGYRQDDNGDLVIFEEEAAVVRKIFNSYITGMSIVKIKAALEYDGILSPKGRKQWPKRTIECILENTKYYGTAIIYKTYKPTYRDKRVNNQGEHDKFASENNNPPIIPKEIFDMVQAEKKRRSNVETDENGVRQRKNTKYSTKKSI